MKQEATTIAPNKHNRTERKADSVRYGPENPHPLSKLKTELVWEGKYDEYGNRREVDVAGCAMPMQRIETIDQPRCEAAAAGQLDLFEKKTQRLDDFRNMLVWGGSKLVIRLPSGPTVKITPDRSLPLFFHFLIP